MRAKKIIAASLVTTMVAATMLTGCGEQPAPTKDAQTTDQAETEVTETEHDPVNFIELALNVMYNDGDHSCYDNAAGESIFVDKEGQYTLTFDCDKDLTPEISSAGVDSLANLTAIYILDMGSKNGAQSPLSACNIMYDSVVVDGTELTVTMDAPKSAFKSNGIFDTNDPINAWDGSVVEEVVSTPEHVANFSTAENPKKIEVTFTLSDMVWGVEETTAGEQTTDSANPYVNPQTYSDMDLSNVSSVEVVKLMGNGINLGNTMEAVNSTYAKDMDATKYEQGWGQPITTKEMIIGMKNMGFDTIRIPVAWTNMMDYENGDYTINTAYLDRVQQIVDWAIDAEMFVIVNDHWDGGWWDKFAYDDQRDEAYTIYENIWTQVGERFKDYPLTLILESANEELGSGWEGKGMKSDDTYTLMNEVNQKFVDLIRAQGGNNANRFLLIAGNNTNIDRTCDDRFKMPTDSATNKLIASVHYYDPWNYCGDKSVDTEEALASYKWGLKEEYEYMSAQIAKMSKFTDAGYGVIIGEYGALCAYLNNKSYQIPNAVEYNSNVLNVCDVNGICPVLWDCNNVYNKSTLDAISVEMRELYTSRCYAKELEAGEGYISGVETTIADLTAAAPDHWEGQETYEAGTPVSWIMWNGGAGTYSVGNEFNDADCTAGITATNTVIAEDGKGDYTVRLDFAGPKDGLTFAALAIADGELLFPGAAIYIKSFKINDEEVPFENYYTCSDDGKCTRVNIYNSWCGDVTEQLGDPKCNFRSPGGNMNHITATPLDPNLTNGMSSIEITYQLVMKK